MIESANHVRNPWINGLKPIDFKLLRERLTPIKNRLTCKPFLPISFSKLKDLNSGYKELSIIASKKKTIKIGNLIFLSPSLYLKLYKNTIGTINKTFANFIIVAVLPLPPLF